MSRRRSYYNEDIATFFGLIIIMVISGLLTLLGYVYNFIRENRTLIINIIVIIVLLILIIILLRKYKDIYNFFMDIKENIIIKKLKKNSLLYSNIAKLNKEYDFEVFTPYYAYYNIYRKSDLVNCNIDDYLLMTIEKEEKKLKEYKDKYNSLLLKYNEYLNRYSELKRYITLEEAEKLKLRMKDYEKYQNRIFENGKIFKVIEFEIIIYVNYSSAKGKVKDRAYKKYGINEYTNILHEYLDLKEQNKLFEINSRVERAKMSESLRYDILKRDNYKCQICGASAKDGAKLQVDHIIPVSKGGKTEPNNLQTLCSRCNVGKSNKLD